MAETDNKIETRVLALDDVELRVNDGDKPKITGYAARFGKWSVDMGFVERIQEGAFDKAIKNSDVRALKNHDKNLLLGRTTSGTLRLDANKVGLKFEADVPNTTTGRDTAEEIRRGDITGCSFAFTVNKDEWKYKEDGPSERTITEIGQLFDVGPVTYPAYPDTTVAVRSLETLKQTIKREEPKPKDEKVLAEEAKQERERLREIDRKYKLAGRIINRNRLADADL
jgi:HK97 family phage prohead protease